MIDYLAPDAAPARAIMLEWLRDHRDPDSDGLRFGLAQWIGQMQALIDRPSEVRIDARLAELAALPDNWDTYGAKPITAEAIASSSGASTSETRTANDGSHRH